MTDRRQRTEQHHRSQVCARIKELKSSCENLIQVRNNLSAKLNELNEYADRLVDEKKQKQQQLQPQQPQQVIETKSSSFKTKLSQCLPEVLQKAEDIAELSEQLHKSKYNN